MIIGADKSVRIPGIKLNSGSSKSKQAVAQLGNNQCSAGPSCSISMLL